MRQRFFVNVGSVSVLLTVQLVDASTQQQHGQRQSQAAVHGGTLPRVWNLAQALEGQDPIVGH